MRQLLVRVSKKGSLPNAYLASHYLFFTKLPLSILQCQQKSPEHYRWHPSSGVSGAPSFELMNACQENVDIFRIGPLCSFLCQKVNQLWSDVLIV